MNFTKNQARAINERDKSILVSAGAGSGKTAVLKTRVQKLVEEGVGIDELLILTFTNAAALEMKGRIASALKEANLTNELEKIESAQITTFDAYFLELVKKYHYLIGISKDISIADYSIIKFEKEKILTRIFDEKLQKQDKQFLSLLTDYTVFDYNDLVDKIIFLYDAKANIFKKDDYLQYYTNPKELFEKYDEFLNLENTHITNALNSISGLIQTEKDEEYLDKVRNYVHSIIQAKTYEDYHIYTSDLGAFPRFTLKSDNKEQIKQHVEIIKDKINSIKKYTEIAKNQVISNLEHTLVHAQVILKILKEMEDALLEFKKEQKAYEFSDITNFAIELVEKHDIVRSQQKSQFKEIMVDEYQDTNDFQNYFIYLISSNNSYMVGDVKQSIYGFRNANPQNFVQLEEDFNNGNEGLVINLMDNFRSRDEVLYGLNSIFDKVMTKEIGGVVYDDKQKLTFGNKAYDVKDANQTYDYQFLNYDRESLKEINIHKKYVEPYIIAKDIRTKVDNKWQVLDFKEGLRDCKYSDFCILTRTKTNYQYYVEMFEYMNIVTHSQLEPEFKTQDLIIFFKSLFRYLYAKENRLINELSIMRSFVFEVSDDEIENYIVSGIKSTSVEEVLDKLKEIKSYHDVSISIVLDRALEKLGVYPKISKQVEAKGTFELLQTLKTMCSNFDNMNYPKTKFIQYLDRLDTSDDLDVATTQDASVEGAVKIMTIHKSKGLEFPIVYLPELESSFSRSNMGSDFFIDKEHGLIIPHIKNYLKTENIATNLYKQRLKNSERSEAIRLLYVALTRAKEQFIFVGSDKINEVTDISNASNFIQVLSSISDDILFNARNVNLLLEEEFLEFNPMGIKSSNIELKAIGAKYNYKNLSIEVEDKKNKRASGDITELPDVKTIKNLKYGTLLHDKLQFIDIKNFEITDSSLLSNVISNMKKHKEFTDYINQIPELEFFDGDIHGFIDCIFEYNDFYLIVDYKLKNVNKAEYIKQITIYKEYLEKIVNKPVKACLYSLMEDEFKYL